MLQEKIKSKFPNLNKILDLKDFNRLRGRKDQNQLKSELEKSKDNGY